MARQLSIRSDRAVEVADRAARALGISQRQVVERALDEFAARTLTDVDANEAHWDNVWAIADRMYAEAPPGTFDPNHDELYDENGLPI